MNGSWYRLNEICSPKQWKTIALSELSTEGYPVYGANGIIGYYSDYTHTEETLLVTCRGATCGELNICQPYSYVNGNAMALDKLDKEKVLIKYLYYYLKNRGFNDVISGSAQPQITRNNISKIKIFLPEKKIQQKIVDLLDKNVNLIDKRKAQIEALDQLTQSVFLEMFGDPSTNPKRWKKVNLEEIAIKEKGAIKSGPFGSQLLISEYVKNGIPVLGIDNVEKNKFVWAKPKAISEQKYKELKAFRVYSGDVLISRTGTVGRTCVVPDDFKEGIIGPNLLKVTLDKNLMLPEVLSIMFNYLPHVINQIKWMSPGATVPVFNTKNLKKVKVLVPDKKVQVEFVKKIKEVEELKSKFILGLTDLEKNYNSLMQRAFKGELFTEEKVSNL
ncbi:restriction endonuclease subunit S [Caldifermentibacillus hisashii]|uniref:restriction endonuclease subunit S n=1 Tax=Caldifermentibacillus hisashii TaxID=996558 RepID=UPI0033691DAB